MNYLYNNKHLNQYLGTTDKDYPDCTTKIVPPAFAQHTLPCFNSDSWNTIIPDYRDMTAYHKVNSRVHQTIVLAGPISQTLTVVPPPDDEKRYVYESDSWTEYVQPVYQRRRCTKYQLITCLTAYYPSLLETLRAAYKSNDDLQFYWNTVLNLDRDNQDFKLAVQKLGITQQQLSDIFSKIQGQQPTAV